MCNGLRGLVVETGLACYNGPGQGRPANPGGMPPSLTNT